MVYVKKNTTHGFTLVETLVAVALFSFIMLMAVGSLVSLISANRKARAISEVVNNVNAPITIMTRMLVDGTDYQVPDSHTINFLPSGASVRTWYRYNSGTQAIEWSPNGTTPWSPLTDTSVRIDDLTFTKVNHAGGGNQQSMVLITMKVTAGNGPKEQTTFNLQTTISERYVAP